jgi:tetratricopeptide (TPR) repeat protein
VANHEPAKATDELDVRGPALNATAEALLGLGELDRAMEAYERVADSGLPGTSPARAFYEIGRALGDAGRDDEATRAFRRAGKIKEEPGAHEVPHAEMAERALTRLASGGGVARPHAEVLAQELAGALRQCDGRALRRLASPSHFAVGLGGHFHFADPNETIDRLEPDLMDSDVRCDAPALKRCGGRLAPRHARLGRRVVRGHRALHRRAHPGRLGVDGDQPAGADGRVVQGHRAGRPRHQPAAQPPRSGLRGPRGPACARAH